MAFMEINATDLLKTFINASVNAGAVVLVGRYLGRVIERSENLGKRKKKGTDKD